MCLLYSPYAYFLNNFWDSHTDTRHEHAIIFLPQFQVFSSWEYRSSEHFQNISSLSQVQHWLCWHCANTAHNTTELFLAPMLPEAEHLPPHHIPFSDEPSILMLSLRRWSLKKSCSNKRACLCVFCCQGLCPKIRTRSYPAPLLFSCINRLGLLSCQSSSDWHRRNEGRSPCQLLVRRHLNKYPHFGNSLTSDGNYISPLRGSCFPKPEGWTASPATATTKGPAAITTSNVTPVRWQLGLSASLLLLHGKLTLESLNKETGITRDILCPGDSTAGCYLCSPVLNQE